MGFQKVALLHSHQKLPALHDYTISDLIDLCGLAACIEETVSRVSIPITPTDRQPLRTFETFLKKERPDLVGISCYTCTASSVADYARLAKDHGATVITGGFHASALPEEMLSIREVDAVVRGEGEMTLAEFVRTGSPEGVAGMSYSNNGTAIHNPDRPVIPNLDILPLPLRGIRPARYGLSGLDYHTDTVYASRGCKGRCTFCANDLVGKSWRKKSNERILEELLTLTPPRKNRRKSVKFWDSNFLTQTDRIEQLCDLILENGLQQHFEFMAETRIEDIIRAEHILEKMRQAGFTRIACGIESPHVATHKHLKKGINLANVERASELLNRADILFSKALIIGHENEGVEDILEYPAYSLAHGVENQNTTFFILTPYPGTELAADMAARDLIKNHNWDLYSNLGAVVEPGEISTSELQALHCAVSMRYGGERRFLRGQSFPSVTGKMIESIATHMMVCSLNPEMSARDITSTVQRARGLAAGSAARKRIARKPSRFKSQQHLVVHFPEDPPMRIGIQQRGDEEVFEIGAADDVASPRGCFHLSADHLLDLVSGVQVHRLAHDGLTLRWRPTAFRPAWLGSFALDLAKLSTMLLKMFFFHTRKRIAENL